MPASPYIGIYREGRIHHLRLDRMIRSAAATRVLSPRAKLRAVRLGVEVIRAKAMGWLDYSDMRRAAPLDTETARAYALRALDAELDAYLCEPVVRTMLIADTDKVSRVELFSGIANILTAQIYALLGGQGRLGDELAKRLDVTVDAPVSLVADRGDHVSVTYSTGGRELTEAFDACVISAPLPVAAAICPDRSALLRPLDEAIGYTQAITVAVGTTVVPDSPAMLVQFPSRENPDVALMFLEHNKAPDRAPAGHGLIGCDWETTASEKWMGAADSDIVEHTLASVRRVFPEVDGHVDHTSVTRWPRALPLTGLGAYRRIGEFNAALDPTDRIQFAADYMSAAGQNTAVEFGTRAARNLLNRGEPARTTARPVS